MFQIADRLKARFLPGNSSPDFQPFAAYQQKYQENWTLRTTDVTVSMHMWPGLWKHFYYEKQCGKWVGDVLCGVAGLVLSY